MANTTVQTTTTPIVFEYFLRVAKNHKNYHLVKKRLKNFIAVNLQDGRDDNSVKLNNNNLTQLYSLAEREAIHMSQEGRGMMGNDKYSFVTCCINFFLRHLLEEGGVDPRRLGMYGQEIFDLTCYALYGDAYLAEMESMNEGAPIPTNDREAWLVSEYVARRQNGEDVTYEDVVRMHEGDNMSVWDENNYRDHNGVDPNVLFNDENDFGWLEDDEDDD